MSDTKPNETHHQPSLWKRVGVYAAIALAIFLLGLIPMWLIARGRAGERDEAKRDLALTQRELRLSRMQNTLASAVINARRGDYEQARQTASDFFTALRAQVDGGTSSALTQAQRESVTPLLARRDDVITLLARSDPASADRLSDLYISYVKAMGPVP